MPRISQRDVELDGAESELRYALIDLQKKYNLTRGENLDILIRVFSSHALISTKHMIREEREEKSNVSFS